MLLASITYDGMLALVDAMLIRRAGARSSLLWAEGIGRKAAGKRRHRRWVDAAKGSTGRGWGRHGDFAASRLRL